MKRILRILVSVVLTLFFAAVLFYCMVAGAAPGEKGLNGYIVKAAFFALLFPGFGCGCVHYIYYLKKKLEKNDTSPDERGA